LRRARSVLGHAQPNPGPEQMLRHMVGQEPENGELTQLKRENHALPGSDFRCTRF